MRERGGALFRTMWGRTLALKWEMFWKGLARRARLSE